MPKPAITIIGHVCIDHNTIDGVECRRWGSPAAYIAHYYRIHAGIIPQIFALYGKDFTDFVSGLNLVTKPTERPTLQYENIVTGGERVQFCHHSDTSPLPEIDKTMARRLQLSDIVIIAPLTPTGDLAYFKKLMSYVPDRAIKALIAQGYTRRIKQDGKIEQQDLQNAADILPLFDIVIASNEDHPSAMSAAKTWASYNDRLNVVITEAEQGATIFTKNTVEHIPTTPLKIEDIKNPIGSGDVFSAQVILGLASGKSINRAVKDAHVTTAKILLSEPFL